MADESRPGAPEATPGPRRRAPARADLVAGVIFTAFGAAFAVAAQAYDIGSLLAMGPGYLPFALGLLLAALGLGIVVKAYVAPDDGGASGPPGHTDGAGTGVLTGIRWRAVVLVAAAVVVFAFTVDGLGLLPAVLVSGVIAALARRETPLWQAVAIGVGLTAASWVIFVLLLQLRLPLLGDWLGG